MCTSWQVAKTGRTASLRGATLQEMMYLANYSDLEEAFQTSSLETARNAIPNLWIKLCTGVGPSCPLLRKRYYQRQIQVLGSANFETTAQDLECPKLLMTEL